MIDPAVPITNPGIQAYPLSSLLTSVQRLVRETFGGYYWVVAEVAEVSTSRQGHYYFTLCEMKDGRQIARVQGNLWASRASYVLGDFKRVTGDTIKVGMQLMLQVKVEMTPLYGLSFTIYNINAEFTLGALEKAKRDAIHRLKEDGVIDMNKGLPLSSLCLRIAVISSQTAAGWGDFSDQINRSDVEPLFRIDLYPAVMQGRETTVSVLEALDQILSSGQDYDAVLLLRGGGSRIDLSAFDDYELCVALAQYPLPILTGIGHERDESVADIVAHTRLKTPTALAEYLIRRAQESIGTLAEAKVRLRELLTDRYADMKESYDHQRSRLHLVLAASTANENKRLGLFTAKIANLLHQGSHSEQIRLDRHRMRLTHLIRPLSVEMRRPTDEFSHRLSRRLHLLLPDCTRQLDHCEQLIRSYDPSRMMQRGFVPVMQGEHTITHLEDIKDGNTLRILLMDGEVEADVRNVKPL